MKKVQILAVLISASFLLTQCTKTGPAGAAGASGAQGPAGPTGATGPANNANVQTTIFNSQSFVVGDNTFAVPSITQAILDSGVVLGYVANTSTPITSWYPLPYFLGSSEIYVYNISIGTVLVYASYAGSGVSFKFDVITGQ